MIEYDGGTATDSLTFGEITVDEAIHDVTVKEDIERYAVYWLECHAPRVEPRDRAAVTELRDELTELLATHENPSWIATSLRSDSLHYVGYTSSLDPRINAHLRGDGSEFCKLFPPHRLRDVWWFASKKEARLAEESIARDLRGQLDNAYVHQN